MSSNNQWYPQRRYHVSLFWPIVLIGLGVVLLLNNANVLPGNVWDWVWRLWPVVFIAWGLDGLLRRELVGPALSIGIGVIFLMANFGWLMLNPVEVILRLWPIFLVSAGIGIIFDRRATGTVGALFGALLILIILGGALWLSGVRSGSVEALPGQTFTQSMERATKANVTLEPTAGSLHVSALAEPTSLVEGTVNSQDDEDVRRTFSVQDGVGNFRLKNDNVFVGFAPGGGDWRTWNLRFNPEVPIDMVVNLGVGDTTLDLTDLQISDLNVNSAVGLVTVNLPREGNFSGKLGGAIGGATVVVPKDADVGVRLHMSNGLVVANVPHGYDKRGNTYTSPNYESAANHIDLDVSQAIGTVTVRNK
jgi:hypothetical protein